MENDWLSANEAGRLSAMRFAKRRADWRLGRWAAKCALSSYLGVPANPQVFRKMEIRSAPSGTPEAFFENLPAAATISLSHRAGLATCALAMPGVDMGCDLEIVEPRSDAFVADYFTLEEQALVERASITDRDWWLALLWSGKESALKALHEGLRLDVRTVAVSPRNAESDSPNWNPMEVGCSDRRIFRGWWRHADHIVRTLVAAPHPDPPIRLQIPEYLPECSPVWVED